MTIQELENQRKQVITDSQTLVKWIFFLIVSYLAFMFWLIRNLVTDDSPYLFIIWAITFFTVYDKFNKKRNIYILNYKKSIIPYIIGKITPDFLYGPQETIDIKVIVDSKLVLSESDLKLQRSDFCSFTSEDHIIFKTFGSLQVCDLNISGDSESSKSNTYHTGLFGFATFPFSFDGITVIHPKNKTFRIFTGEEVRLESPRFMEIWDVQTNNQLGARMALGTDIMNNLLYLNDNLKVPISMSFIENKVYFAITQKGFLEPSIYESVYDTKEIQRFAKELSVIHEIVQTFKLYQSK